MKKRCLVLALLFVVLFCSACVSLEKQNVMHFKDFGEIFINKLPEDMDDSLKCGDIYINKANAFFGDPNYVLSFTIVFEDANELEMFLESYDLSLAEERHNDNYICYIFQGSEESFEEYTNERIMDGLFFTYEVIIVKKGSPEISCLYAYVWDYWKDEFLISTLNDMWG